MARETNFLVLNLLFIVIVTPISYIVNRQTFFFSCRVLLQDVVSKSKEVKGKAHYRPLCNLRVYLGANFTVVRPSYLRNHHQGQDQFNIFLYRLIWSLLLPFPLRPPPCCCTTPQIQSKILDTTVLDFLNTLFCHF